MRILIFISLFILLPTFTNATEIPFKVGQKNLDFIPLPKNGNTFQLPLPGGQWTVIGVESAET